ncbi:MAG: hypothetical protein FWD66_07185 [Paludibacter sp.]|nr:hypothetical protein [Paludibacter sp.]
MKICFNTYIKWIFALVTGQISLLFLTEKHKNSAKIYSFAFFIPSVINFDTNFIPHTYNYGMNYPRSGSHLVFPPLLRLAAPRLQTNENRSGEKMPLFLKLYCKNAGTELKNGKKQYKK